MLACVVLLALPGSSSAQISPGNMRSGVDSLTVPSGGTLVSANRTIFTVPAGNEFVLTDIVCGKDVGFTILHDVLDNGTIWRWGPLPSESLNHLTTGIAFAAGHNVVLRGSSYQPNVPTTIHYSWSGYLVPAVSGSVPESQIQGLGFLVTPNPSEQVVSLRFELRAPADVALSIYDVQGRLVRLLQAGRAAKGPHSIAWDGRDTEGRLASPGTYFARLASSDAKNVKALVRIR